jgi:hypothetical protein
MTIIPFEPVTPTAPEPADHAGFAVRDGIPDTDRGRRQARSTDGMRVPSMSRKVSGVMAGWLAAVSVALGQTGGQTGHAPVKGKTLSPYYATASTVDWSDDGTDQQPELLPPIKSKPVVPAAAAADEAPVKQAGAIRTVDEPATSLPATTPPPPPASKPATNGNGAKPIPAVVPAGSCGSGNCMTQAPSCNCDTRNYGPAVHLWANPEFLLWWAKGQNVPPLVTTSPSWTPRDQAGILGWTGTCVIAGGCEVDDGIRPGFRIQAGMWLDQCEHCGVEGSFFFLGTKSEDRTFCGSDAQILARPFYDLNPNQQGAWGNAANGVLNNAELVNYPGIVQGSVSVRAESDLIGFDVNFRHNLICRCDYRLDLLAGYRYLNLNDEVCINESLVATDPNNPQVPQGTQFCLTDKFKTENTFNGGQFGFAGERKFCCGRLTIGGRSLFAFGNNESTTTICGDTTIKVPGQVPQYYNGGLLAQGSNIGCYRCNEFGFVYQGDTVIGYQLTDCVKVFAAYDYMWWTGISRAGEQIDLAVNSSQIPPGQLVGQARPAFTRHDNDYWVQGFGFGVELKY